MNEPTSKTVILQAYLDRLRDGDETAREQLLQGACDRLEQLTRKMLRRYPRVKRWEQTDDVLQNVNVRLHRALGQISPPTVRDFLKLATVNIRRELLDMVKHYYGPRGLGANHASRHDEPGTDSPRVEQAPADLTHEPARLAAWGEFHEKAGELPEDEREVFDLLWYQGLHQAEVAGLLGVTERTVQRRWQAARLHLFDALGGQLPPGE